MTVETVTEGLRISLAARLSKGRYSLFKHMIIISEKKIEEK